MSRYAKFHVRVHARNRNAEYGQRVTVVARTREEAVTRAIDVGWSGHRSDARVTFDSVEDLDPRECPHVTLPRPDHGDPGTDTKGRRG